MAETKTPGDKTLSVGSKTLSLKPRAETGVVRQSFSHGRTKQVVVEKKPKRRMPGDPPSRCRDQAGGNGCAARCPGSAKGTRRPGKAGRATYRRRPAAHTDR